MPNDFWEDFENFSFVPLIVAPTYPRDHDLNKLLSSLLELHIFWPYGSWGKILSLLCILVFSSVNPNLRSHHTPGDLDLNKVESTLPEDASTQIKTILAFWYLRSFQRFVSIYSYKRFRPLYKPQVTSFSCQMFLRMRFQQIFLYVFLCRILVPHCRLHPSP